MTSSRYVVAVWLLGLAVGGCRAVKATPAGAVSKSAPAVASGGGPVLLAVDDGPLAPPLPRARPITAAATVNTPVCLGFLPSGLFAYVLATNNDPGIPEWWLQLQIAGIGHEFSELARTSQKRQAQATFSALVVRINAFIREHRLVACTTAVARADGRFEAVVRGTRVTVSYDDGDLVVAPEGQPPVVRPQTEAEDLSLVAVYTAPTLPGIAVVLRDHIGCCMVAERTEWVVLE